MGVVFYFLLIRPQKKKMNQQKSLLDSLEVGDEIVMIGGIFGTLRSIDDDEDLVEIEIAPGLTIRAVRGAIARKHFPEQDSEHDEPWYEDVEPELPESEEDEGADTGS
jgi:preprotein translocase subunit YajC